MIKNVEDLKSVLGENVKILNINSLMENKGILVDVHIGRSGKKISLPSEVFGIDDSKTDEFKKFYKQYVKDGKVQFIPNIYEKKFQSIETNIRQYKKSLSIGFDGRYMTIADYKEFKRFLREQKVKYYEVRDEILAQWDSLFTSFKQYLNCFLDELHVKDKENIEKYILSKVPNKEEYGEACYIDTSLTAFPSFHSLAAISDELTDDMKDSIIKNSMKTVYEVLSTILSGAFSKINDVLVYYDKNGKFLRKQIDNIKKMQVCIKRRNIFGQPNVKEIAMKIDKIKENATFDEIEESLENILIYIYATCKNLDIDLEFNFKNAYLTQTELNKLSAGFEF